MADNIVDEFSNFNYDSSTLPTPEKPTGLNRTTDYILDANWSRKAFMISGEKFGDPDDKKNRFFNSARRKYTSTRFGESIGINPKSQRTRYADIREKGVGANRNDVTLGSIKGNLGMGRFYSENHDDTAQIIYLRAGVPMFTSLYRFFSLAMDPDIMNLTVNGRPAGFMYQAGQTIMQFLCIRANPVLSAGIWLLGAITRGWNTVFTRPTSKYYTLKPTMFLYWFAVNSLMNTIAVNMGLLPRFMVKYNAKQTLGEVIMDDQESLDVLQEMMPEIFTGGTTGYGFDVFAIANKAQRLQNEKFLQKMKQFDQTTATNFEGYVKGSNDSVISNPEGDPSLMNLVQSAISSVFFNKIDDQVVEKNVKEGSGDDDYVQPPDGLGEHLDAAFKSGGQFLGLRVDYVGTVTESFSTNVTESDLSMKFNSGAVSARSLTFSLAGGNIGDGMIANALEATATGLKDLAMGGLSFMTMGLSNALAGFLGGNFIDVPKHWESSTVSLPKVTYTMQCFSPYNNTLSQIKHLWMPVCCMLGLALPRSVGKNMYTQPFGVELYHRGVVQIRNGIISDLTISRGTGNQGFDKHGKTLALDITFSVVDMSSIMHMPISSGEWFNSSKAEMDEDGILYDYLAVLGGQDIYSQIYGGSKAMRNIAKKIRSTDKLTSPAYWASKIHNDLTADTLLNMINPLSWLAKGVDAVGSGSGILNRAV